MLKLVSQLVVMWKKANLELFPFRFKMKVEILFENNFYYYYVLAILLRTHSFRRSWTDEPNLAELHAYFQQHLATVLRVSRLFHLFACLGIIMPIISVKFSYRRYPRVRTLLLSTSWQRFAADFIKLEAPFMGSYGSLPSLILCDRIVRVLSVGSSAPNSVVQTNSVGFTDTVPSLMHRFVSVKCISSIATPSLCRSLKFIGFFFFRLADASLGRLLSEGNVSDLSFIYPKAARVP